MSEKYIPASEVELKRDADFQPAFEKFMAELKAGDPTSEMHGFCSGWIARRALVAEYRRELVEALELLAESWLDWAREAPNGHGLVVARIRDKFVPELRADLAKGGKV